MSEVDLDGSFVEGLPWLAGQPHHDRPLTDPEQIRMADVIPHPVGHH